MYKTHFSWFTFHGSLSVPITLSFHPKKPRVSQAYFIFPSQNAVPFLIAYLLKTNFIISLSNQEFTFFFFWQVGPFLIVSQKKLFLASQSAHPLLLRLTYFRILSKQMQ